jgi:uncharacterized repeat protein (TIGR01451 family)
MGGRIVAATAAAITVLTLAGGAGAAPAPGFTELVSVSSAGVQGNQDSETPAVSADGRFVAFVSLADNLVAGDTNGFADVFVRDRLLGTTERVSVSSAGRQSDGHSGVFNGMGDPSISTDGRFVVFDSEATNFAKGDTNTTPEVFVHDRQTGTTELVSIAADGSPAGASSEGTISDDGNRVAFVSYADNIVLPDTNFNADVYVYDRTTGAMVRVTDAPDGSEANSQSFRPDLDADGHLVAFDSFASNLVASGADDGSVDVFVHDLDTGVTESISGPESSGSFGHSSGANITPDGGLVVFDTQDPALVPGDANSFTRDVVLYDRTSGTYEIVSVNDSGAQGNDDSSFGVTGSDGRYVAFTSFARNLVPEDTNFRYDVFVRDRIAGTTRRVSVGSFGEEGDLDSLAPAIDADGGVIAFSSHSTTFVPESGQSFFASDIFVRDARPPADLALTLADSPDPVTIRSELTYTATITNGGPTPATGVTLVAELPADATFVSASGAACTRGGKGKSDGTLTCSVGALATGASATVTILVRPSRAGTLTLTARVRADQPDPAGSDNSDTETTTVIR